jgi:UrcA family protein
LIVLKQPRRKTTALLLFTATAALGLMLTAPLALAQDNGAGDDNAYDRPAPGEQVIVTAPRFHHIPGPTGSDIVVVSMSRPVRIADLDLNTAWGRDTLRDRVRLTAANICAQLLTVHTAGASGPACYEEAVRSSIHDANYQVRDAYYTMDDDFF